MVRQAVPGEVALSLLISRAVRERTHGAVRGLSVSARNGHFVVRGQVRSFYAKQLAIAAIQAVSCQEMDADIALEMDVVPPPDDDFAPWPVAAE